MTRNMKRLLAVCACTALMGGIGEAFSSGIYAYIYVTSDGWHYDVNTYQDIGWQYGDAYVGVPIVIGAYTWIYSYDYNSAYTNNAYSFTYGVS